MLCFISLPLGFALLSRPILHEVETWLCKYSFSSLCSNLGGKKSVILWNQVNTRLCSKLVGEVPREVEQTERDISELLMIPCQAHGEAADAHGCKTSKVRVPTCGMQWKPWCERRFLSAALTSVIWALSQAGGSNFDVFKAQARGTGLSALSLNNWLRIVDMQMSTRC